MTGNSSDTNPRLLSSEAGRLSSTRTVVVNGDPTVIDLLDSALDGGRYDMTFVDANDGAYSSIKLLQPDLVILYARIEDPDGFQLLTMLKMDPATQLVPVLTFTEEEDGTDAENIDAESAPSDLPAFPVRHASRMN
jgi:CheY-like chemotaxis protein